MANGRRYNDTPKLNIKKVIVVLLVFAVIIAMIFGIIKMLNNDSKSVAGKIENVYYYTIYSNGKWGVINSYGENIVDASYDEMIVIPDPAQDIFVCTYDVDYSSGTYKTKVINSKGKEVVKNYNKVEAIANYDKSKNIWYEKNVFKVEKDGKYGLINYSGKELLPLEYESISPVLGVQNSLVIEKNGVYGLCDDAGNIIIEPKYKTISKIGEDYKNGYIIQDSNDKFGIIGFDKEEILETKYVAIKDVCGEDIYAVKEGEKYQIINKSGEKKFNATFDDISEINKESIVAMKNGKYGVTDMNGETKIDFKYDKLTYTNGNDYIAKSGDKYGVISLDGNTKIETECTNISYVNAGNFMIADYVENGNFVSQVYDSNYQIKVTGIISEINSSKGYIRVHTGDEYKYYNFKFEEKEAASLLTSNTLFLSKKNGKYGFVDKSGNVIIDYVYDDATEQNSSGYAAIKKDGVWGAIDINGNIVVEPTYNLDNNTKIDFINAWHLCEDPNANYYLDV